MKTRKLFFAFFLIESLIVFVMWFIMSYPHYKPVELGYMIIIPIAVAIVPSGFLGVVFGILKGNDKYFNHVVVIWNSLFIAGGLFLIAIAGIRTDYDNAAYNLAFAKNYDGLSYNLSVLMIKDLNKHFKSPNDYRIFSFGTNGIDTTSRFKNKKGTQVTIIYSTGKEKKAGNLFFASYLVFNDSTVVCLENNKLMESTEGINELRKDKQDLDNSIKYIRMARDSSIKQGDTLLAKDLNTGLEKIEAKRK